MKTTDKIVSITKRYFTPQDLSDKFYELDVHVYGYIIETDQKIYALGIDDSPNRNCPVVFSGSNGEIALDKNIFDNYEWMWMYEEIKTNRGNGGSIILDEDEVLADYMGAEIVEVQLDGKGFELEWDSMECEFTEFIDFKTTKGVLSFCVHNEHDGWYGAEIFIGFIDKNTHECQQKKFSA